MLCRYACRTVALATAITLNVPVWAQASPAGHWVPRQTTGVSTSGYPVAADSIPSSLTLDEALQLALARSPVLAQARAEIEAGRNKVEYDSQLPDPALTLDAQNLPASTLALNQSGMSMLGIGVSQKFPPPGKLGLIRRRLEQDTNAL
ncbi:MAG: TolC family protein, partial [Gammaproteobacteria bacterium]|nr:TolC family protein [Gammaproteobacteria bacterium]